MPGWPGVPPQFRDSAEVEHESTPVGPIVNLRERASCRVPRLQLHKRKSSKMAG